MLLKNQVKILFFKISFFKVLYFIFLFSNLHVFAEKVVFIKPVTDLFGHKLSRFGENFEKEYVATMCSTIGSKNSCMRMAQALFNEVYEVTNQDVSTGEIQIESKQMLHAGENKKLKPLKFWTLQKNVKFFSVIEDLKLMNFPEEMDYKNPETLLSKNTLVLIWPWKDRNTDILYSAATRFVRSPEHDKKNRFAVKVFYSKKNRFQLGYVPKKLARLCDERLSNEERINKFNKQIKALSLQTDGIIPYVWGGRSFTKKFKDEKSEIKKGTFFSKIIEYWNRDKITAKPYTGYDCSSLIMTTAQIFGIPYFYKTTSAAFWHAPATRKSKINDGDVVTYRGHIFVVYDAKNNMIVDASGYRDSFGKVAISDISERYLDSKDNKPIDTKILFNLHKNKKGIKKLNTENKIVQNIDAFKIIDLINLF